MNTTDATTTNTARVNRRAFTLVELLTIIAIIGILAAIIIPAVGQVRESARAVQCASNLRQIQMANIAWATDNKGGYAPLLLVDKDDASRTIIWYQNPDFLAYLARERTSATVERLANSLNCPTARLLGNSRAFTCGANAHGRGGEWVKGYVRQIRMEEILRPSKTMAFADALDWQLYADTTLYADGATGGYTKELESPSAGGSTTHVVAWRHGGKANLVYFDGHTARLPVDPFKNDEAGKTALLWLNKE
ncbi:MAG: prepilin-type N-terminal cleavage/methylation domain-containing protein [Opitutaceae bacterium]|jgi:prepilin-type processing-associated H-X9-DG protein/prepilin-type N-terminal cleavage/methylation domain-containing protein|nr:prepilin-type N-terminal cleavage/methylation domain-containing protein [Opitutaceae bacterium]